MEDEIIEKRDQLIDALEQRMHQRTQTKRLYRNNLKERGFNNFRILRQDCSYSRRRYGHIAGYATVFTTRKTDKKTSQDPEVIKSSLLSTCTKFNNFAQNSFHL